MIWYDDGYGGTQDSLEYFRQHREQIGPIVEVSMVDYYQNDEWIKYPFKIRGEMGQIWLSGCNSGYSGGGPHGAVAVLKELGYQEPYCSWPLSKAEFGLGPPARPETLAEHVEPLEVTDACEEVFDVIQTYYNKHGRMPTVHEIADLADMSSKHTVWLRLRALEQAKRIRRQPRKARAIEIL